MKEYLILLIPFLGTSLGAAMVFFLKKEMDSRLEKLLLGFASGVMIAASVWSLLIRPLRWQRNKAVGYRGSLPQQDSCWAWGFFFCSIV